MPTYDMVIKGGTIFDGLQTPRFKARHRDQGRPDRRRSATSRRSEAAEVVDAIGQARGAGRRRPAHPLRQPGVLGPVVHHVGLARGHQRGHRQLRLRLRPVQARRTATGPCWPSPATRRCRCKTMRAGMPWDWVTFPEFLDSVDRTPKGVNVMAFVPLAPLYGYVAGIDQAKAHRVTDEQLEEMCRLLIEGMEAGGCGWSAQISGEIGNVQLDYDGTPMVTDCMTEREVVAFSRALALGRPRRGADHRVARHRRPDGPRERPPHDLERPPRRRRAQPARRRRVLAPGRAQAARRTTTRRRACGSSRRRSPPTSSPSSPSRTTTSSTPCRCGRRPSSAPSKRSGPSSPTPSAGRRMKELDDARGGLFGAGYATDEIKVNWISSDAPNAQEIKERYEGFTIGEIADREGKHPIDAMLDIAVAGDLKVGFATKLLETPPQSMKEIATSPVALPGVSDGGAHTKFVTTARYPTELLAYWVREHEIMSLEEAHWRLSAYPALAAGLKDRGFLREGRRPT